MKKLLFGMLNCMVLLSMAGCGKMDDSSVQNLSDTKDSIIESEADLAESNNEYSDKSETDLEEDNNEYLDKNVDSLYSSDISNYQIFTAANSTAELKNLYYNIDEFIDSDSSDAVVKGNITEIEYVYIDGCAYSKLTVDVVKAYKGEVQETITVYDDGGYTRLSDEKEQIEAYFDLSQYTEEEMDNLLINHTFMGAEHSKVGDVVILFLKSNEGSIWGDSYRINCSVFGRYTLSQDKYVRPEFIVENDNQEGIATYSNMDEFEVSVSKSMLEDKLSQLLNCQSNGL
jgi:hypothetical protein